MPKTADEAPPHCLPITSLPLHCRLAMTYRLLVAAVAVAAVAVAAVSLSRD